MRFEILRDPVWNNIRVDEPTLQLVDTEVFQRLRYVRQLGWTYLVYPGATHSRFEHALGTHHLSRRTLALLCEAEDATSIDEDEQAIVRSAALLHDVGKIAVPESILSKPGPLSDTERELVERHSLIGFELLRDLGLSPVDTYVLHHHEQWAGTGYPYGLAGAEIPFGSRLIHVADAFHALTSDRAYRRAVSIEAAMHELHGESGRQFDPLVVSALHDHLAHPATTIRRNELQPAWSS